MSLDSEPHSPLPDADFTARFRAERSRVLRRRIFWFCACFLLLLVFSVLGTTNFSSEQVASDPEFRRQLYFGLLYDGLLFLVCAGGIAYLWRWRPERSSLVVGLIVMVVIGMGISIPFEMVQMRNELRAKQDTTSWAMWGPGLYALGAFALIHGLASVLVPMRVRESLWIVVPCWVIYIVALLAIRTQPTTAIVLAMLFLLAASIGVGWSAWRYAEFDSRFRADELKGHYKEIAAELSYARRIHEALFPPPVERGDVRIAYRYEPMREIGGDFLFVHPLAHPPAVHHGPVTAVVLDVTGHGVPAALAVNRLHGELQRLFALQPNQSPGEALTALNAYSHASLTPSAMYASALIIRLDPQRRVVEWASAGHPPALLRRGDGRMEELAPTAVMLGVLDAELFEHGQKSVEMQPGDALVAYTDGASEVAGTDKKQLGADELTRTIAATPPGTDVAGKIASALMERVRQHRVGRVTDDTLIVEMGIEKAG